MKNVLTDYYRCNQALGYQVEARLSQEESFFIWQGGTICYGRSASGTSANRAGHTLHDRQNIESIEDGTVNLPFDPEEVIENLRREHYSAHFRDERSLVNLLLRRLYYLARPHLSVPVRKKLQRFSLRKWKKIRFPEWPVDCTVDQIHRQLLAAVMKANGLKSVPFIWFWPYSFQGCAIVTHDVESERGREYCGRLMEMDESYGFKSSFQIVPEDRYQVTKEFLQGIVERGFEVNVHDLNHDGRLYAEHGEFLKRVTRINSYGEDFNAVGFRSGIMYRNADWFGALNFLYDMSIPNVAHLDPQHGGCCTVMPYHIGKIIEIPLTCTQDYTLFNILNDYSTSLWKQQIDKICANNGLVSILVHPDYIIESRANAVYKNLLAMLAEARETSHLWTPLPRELAEWWQQRSQMELVSEHGAWHVAGAGSERASVGWAHLSGDTVTYSNDENQQSNYMLGVENKLAASVEPFPEQMNGMLLQ